VGPVLESLENWLFLVMFMVPIDWGAGFKVSGLARREITFPRVVRLRLMFFSSVKWV
jgi:hypothetical protein